MARVRRRGAPGCIEHPKRFVPQGKADAPDPTCLRAGDAAANVSGGDRCRSGGVAENVGAKAAASSPAGTPAISIALPTASPSPSSSRATTVAIGAIALAAALPYLNTLAAGYVFDDH